MGTPSTTKYLKYSGGSNRQEAALTTSAGAGDAQKLPALNAAGVLDLTIVNAKTTSAGAGDSGKIPAFDATGRLDVSMMPIGIGADTNVLMSSEALAAGSLVNIWSNAGAFAVRKADATIEGKEAHGFVLVAFASGVPTTVYFEGTNTAMSGLTPGPQYLSITAGTCASTPPTGSGNVAQRVGLAVSATSMNFQDSDPLTLA